MKKENHDTICSVLNGIPVMIQASRSCGTSRPSLFWTSFEITPLEGESLEKGDKTSVLHMKQVPSSVLGNFWDPKWGPHKDFQFPFPCITGWNQKHGHKTPQQLWGTTEVPTNPNSVGRKTVVPAASSCTRRETWPTKSTALGCE